MDGQRMVECRVDCVGEDGIQDGHGYDKAECCSSLVPVGDVEFPWHVEERWGLAGAAGGVHVYQTHGMLHRQVMFWDQPAVDLSRSNRVQGLGSQ